MTKLFLAAGVAALAIAAPASAERGGKGGDKGQAAKIERGNSAKSQARAERGAAKSAGIERRSVQRVAMFDRGEKRRDGDDKAERRAARAVMGDMDRRAAKAQRRDRDDVRAFKIDREEIREQRLAKRDQRVLKRIERRNDRIDDKILAFDDDRFNPGRGGPLINGCPPGLFKRGLPCMPPGHAKRLQGQIIPASYRERALPLSLRNVFRDNDDYYYRYGDGYVYRVNRENNLIASLLPLIGGGYTVGQAFPTSYMNSYVPDYYRAFYPDSSDDYYRYANGYVYEIDRDTGLIEDMIPMYDSGYGVGQMLPASYSYYNVPYQYRSYYQDQDDYYYRYAPGAIYQVDRSSNLITAIASLLAGDLGVGSRLPMSYSAYNVPLSYRDRYYDTNEAWYRYNDGNIYRVDPTTQLITAVIRAIV